MMQATKNKRLPHFTGYRLQATTTFQHRHTFRTKYSGRERTKKLILSPLFSAPSAHHIGYRLPHRTSIEHDYNFQDRTPPTTKGLSRSRKKNFKCSRITPIASASNCARVQLYSSSIDSRRLISINPATTTMASLNISTFCK